MFAIPCLWALILPDDDSPKGNLRANGHLEGRKLHPQEIPAKHGKGWIAGMSYFWPR